ncbi:MAG: hypothetical protein AAFZ15_33100, partial [Bacteroidota bacterium]
MNSNFSKAESAISNSMQLPVRGKFNWHIVIYLKAILGFHSGKIKMAFHSWSIANNHLSLMAWFAPLRY